MSDKPVVSYRNIATFAGAFIAFLIGSGFATGQEIMQYFAAYGFAGIACAVLVFFLLAFVGISFITVGQQEKFNKGSEIYQYYCGKVIGTFFDYFSIIFIFMSFIVMVGGAGATLHQQYNLPTWQGGILIGILSAGTVIFGLNKIVAVIGNIGPLITCLALFLGVAGIVINPGGLAKVSEILPTMSLLKASNVSWVFAAGSYVGFCMLWLAAFMAAMGKTANSKKEAALGAFWGAFLFSLAIIVVTLGLLANVELVAGSLVPNLLLAGKIHPYLAIAFSVIVFLGIYTTAVPLLWTVCARISEEGTSKFKAITVGLAVIGVVIGLSVSFDKLVNIIYVINGYVGITLLALMLCKPLKDKFMTKVPDNA